MTGEYLTTEELAKRWRMSVGTIHNRRSNKKQEMPRSLKIGTRVLWPVDGVEEFEKGSTA